MDNAFKRNYLPSGIFRLDGPASARAAELKRGKECTEDGFDHVLACRETLLFYAMSLKVNRYVSGHFCFSERLKQAFGDEWVFITLLRNPKKRWFSHYLYNRYKERKEQHCKVDTKIEEAIDSERGKDWGNAFVKYYGGLRDDRDYRSEDAISKAEENLGMFDTVGTLENLKTFKTEVRRKHGLPLVIIKENRSPLSAEQKAGIITPEIEKRVEEICAPDMKVYRRAQEISVIK